MSFCCFSKTFTQDVTPNEITKSMKKMFLWKFLQVFLSYWEFLSFLLSTFRVFNLKPSLFFFVVVCNGKLVSYFL